MPRWCPILVMALFALAAAPARAAKPNVVATTSIIGDWVKNVGGDDIDLTTLLGPDSDPHEYEPVPADSLALSRATLIFENGLGLEQWLDKLYTSAESPATRVVLSRRIETRRPPSEESSSTTDRDPHVWQNLNNAAAMVTAIRDALAAADPPHAAGYSGRMAAYIAQLNRLDTYATQQIHSIPPARRKLITSHDAFGYFGQRYGLDVSRSALESMTTEASDPSARQIAEVVRQITAAGVPVIFLENIQNPKLINQIAAEASVKVGPPLYTDALGPVGGPGETYLKMMRYNVDALVKALR